MGLRGGAFKTMESKKGCDGTVLEEMEVLFGWQSGGD